MDEPITSAAGEKPAAPYADPAESLRRRNAALEAAQLILTKPRSGIEPAVKAKLYIDIAKIEQDQQRLALDAMKPAGGRGISARVNPDGSVNVDMWEGLSDDELDAQLDAERRQLAELEAAAAAADAS